jgi:hypothetical protein
MTILNISPLAQKNDNWCWATCIYQIANFKGNTDTSLLCNLIKKNFDLYYKSTLSSVVANEIYAEIYDCQNRCSIDKAQVPLQDAPGKYLYQDFFLEPCRINSTQIYSKTKHSIFPPFSFIIQQINNTQPILLGGWKQEVGTLTHAIVIMGYDVNIRNIEGIFITNSMTGFDPCTNPNGLKVYYIYNQFVKMHIQNIANYNNLAHHTPTKGLISLTTNFSRFCTLSPPLTIVFSENSSFQGSMDSFQIENFPNEFLQELLESQSINNYFDIKDVSLLKISPQRTIISHQVDILEFFQKIIDLPENQNSLNLIFDKKASPFLEVILLNSHGKFQIAGIQQPLYPSILSSCMINETQQFFQFNVESPNFSFFMISPFNFQFMQFENNGNIYFASIFNIDELNIKTGNAYSFEQLQDRFSTLPVTLSPNSD